MYTWSAHSVTLSSASNVAEFKLLFEWHFSNKEVKIELFYNDLSKIY